MEGERGGEKGEIYRGKMTVGNLKLRSNITCLLPTCRMCVLMSLKWRIGINFQI